MLFFRFASTPLLVPSRFRPQVRQLNKQSRFKRQISSLPPHMQFLLLTYTLHERLLWFVSSNNPDFGITSAMKDLSRKLQAEKTRLFAHCQVCNRKCYECTSGNSSFCIFLRSINLLYPEQKDQPRISQSPKVK